MPHNLWIANPGAHNVLVLPRGSTDPARTLNDTNQPNDVAVCDEGGVAVYPPHRTVRGPAS